MASPTEELLDGTEISEVPNFNAMKVKELNAFYETCPYEVEDFEDLTVGEKRKAFYEIFNDVIHGVEGETGPYSPEEDEEEEVEEEEPPKKPKTSTKAKASKAKSSKAKGTEVAVDDTVKGEVLSPDLISTTAHDLENLPNEKTAHNMLGELLQEGDFNYFKLGGVLAVIQANKWFGEHANFKEWVEHEVKGLQYRKATRLTKLYNDVVNSGVEWEDVQDIGWTLLKEIAPILTPKNVKGWVKKAKKMTTLQLIEAVKEDQLGKAIEGDQEGGGLTSTPVTTKTFKVHEDQKEIILKALEEAKKAAGTDVDTVALEFICMDFLGSGGKEAALEILNTLEKVIPELSIEAEFEEEEGED
jgi:hypothetical protein